MRLTLESNVQVDGIDTYVGGMDLGTILRAAFPVAVGQRRVDLGRLRITVEQID